MQLYKEFFFEAAHCLRSAPHGHPNSRIHGHSFRVRVTIEGEPDAQAGLLMDLGDLVKVVDKVREKLDHRFLNEIPGLEYATLENLTRWIWQEIKPSVPLLAEIAVSRDSCMEGCVYHGKGPALDQRTKINPGNLHSAWRQNAATKSGTGIFMQPSCTHYFHL